MDKKMLEILKEKYLEYKDGESIHDYCVCCDIAKELFGWTDEQIEEHEDKWSKEFYERRCY